MNKSGGAKKVGPPKKNSLDPLLEIIQKMINSYSQAINKNDH